MSKSVLTTISCFTTVYYINVLHHRFIAIHMFIFLFFFSFFFFWGGGGGGVVMSKEYFLFYKTQMDFPETQAMSPKPRHAKNRVLCVL